jgi:hypothetical protein
MQMSPAHRRIIAEMPDDDLNPGQRLARIQELWLQLRDTRDPKQRALLEARLRAETDAYKSVTGRAFDPSAS